MDAIQANSAASLQLATQLYALKKTSELQSQSALQLLQGVSAPTPSSNPPHLGQGIDVNA